MKLFTLCVLTLLALLTAAHTHAHDAPSGVAYPSDCCTGHPVTGDCKPVACGDIEQIGERQWRHKGVTFMENNVRQPFDGQCHVCSWASVGRCIFFPLSPSS